ncbi:MAG: GNAT family N-acetyltransferase [Huintestinicola sp.]
MVRRICVTDRDEYLKMASEFYNSDAVSHPVPAENFANAFEHMINGGLYMDGYILESVGKTAGFCTIAKTYSQEAGGMVIWIEDLYVRPQFRSHGLGSELFDYLEKECTAMGAVRQRLEITESNTAAKRLYERRGFEVCPYIPMIREL